MPEMHIKETQMEREQRNDNFEWLASQNLSQYKGCWISIVNKKIVAQGPTLKEVLTKTKQLYPQRVPYVIQVPKPDFFAL